jgi:hypothetical protein
VAAPIEVDLRNKEKWAMGPPESDFEVEKPQKTKDVKLNKVGD